MLHYADEGISICDIRRLATVGGCISPASIPDVAKHDAMICTVLDVSIGEPANEITVVAVSRGNVDKLGVATMTFAIWDPGVERVISQQDLHHGADYTPYEGLRVRGWPVRVLLAGKTAAQSGEMSSIEPLGTYLTRNRSELCVQGFGAP